MTSKENKASMKKLYKIIGIVLLAVVCIVVLFLGLTINNLKKRSEENFDSMQVRISEKLIRNSYNKYILKESEKYDKACEKMIGRTLTAEEKVTQMKLFMGEVACNVNTGSIKSKKLGMEDYWMYYDSDMNPILPDENDAIYYQVAYEDDECKGKLYYIYTGDEFSKAMSDVKNQIADGADAHFTIKNLYIKDFTFVPEYLEYYCISKDGNVSEIQTISMDKTKEEMLADGYELVEVNESFMDENYLGNFTYVASRNTEVEEVMNKYLQEYKKTGGANLRKVLKNGLINYELIDVRACEFEGTDEKIYMVTYKKNVLFYELLL